MEATRVFYEVKTNVTIEVQPSVGDEELKSGYGTPMRPFEVRFTLEDGRLPDGACVLVYGWRRYEGKTSAAMSSAQYRRFDGEWSEDTPGWLRGLVAGAENYAASRQWEGKA